MTAPVSLDSAHRRVPPHRRFAAIIAVALARILAGRPPARIRALLTRLRTGARPASVEQALAARDAVVATSTRCAGEYCLQRSLAIVLLCRLHGRWPAWCVGVRTDPFQAHAWVEAGGQPVAEHFGPGHYRLLLSVPAAPARSSGDRS